MEASNIPEHLKSEIVDMAYFDNLVDATCHDIAEFGDLEWFMDDIPSMSTDHIQDLAEGA